MKGNKQRTIQFDFDKAFVNIATLIGLDTIDIDGSDTINAPQMASNPMATQFSA